MQAKSTHVRFKPASDGANARAHVTRRYVLGRSPVPRSDTEEVTYIAMRFRQRGLLQAEGFICHSIIMITPKASSHTSAAAITYSQLQTASAHGVLLNKGVRREAV